MDNSAIERALNERFLLQNEYLGMEKPVNSIMPLVSVAVATYQHANYIKECNIQIKSDCSLEIVNFLNMWMEREK